MPSIIGNSTITSIGGMTGPTGPRGPIGPIGSPGNSNANKGATGNTGAYILNTVRNSLGGIIFELSDGKIIGPIYGFTGPSTYYSDTRGITYTETGSFLNPFIQVVGGKTLEFRGISAIGNISVSLNSDKSLINLNIGQGSFGAGVGITQPNYIVYVDKNGNVSSSRIGITGSDNILSFGLTADNGATGSYVRVYSDFIDKVFNIGTLHRAATTVTKNNVITGNDSGGLILNLNNYSVYSGQTPIGITAFTLQGITNSIQSFTFLINGSDVWNFPKNVFFENSAKGLKNYSLLEGMNIVHIWTTNGGLTFNGVIAERGIGSTNFYSDGLGSCCIDGAVCTEYTDVQTCLSFGGVFNPLRTCSESACFASGSCCIGTQCFSDVTEDACLGFGGQFISQGTCSPNPCNTTPTSGSCCGPGATCQDNKVESDCPGFWWDVPCSQLNTICGRNTVGICGDPIQCEFVGGPDDPNDITRAQCDALRATSGKSNWRFFPYDGPEQPSPNPWPGCVTGICCSSTVPPNPLQFTCTPGQTKPQCDALGDNGRNNWFPNTTSCSASSVRCVSICPSPSNCLGSCCKPDNTCQETTEQACSSAGGTWFRGFPCSSNICVGPRPTLGACCNSNNVCNTTTQTECTEQGGSWLENTPCTPVSPCADENTFDIITKTKNTNGIYVPTTTLILQKVAATSDVAEHYELEVKLETVITGPSAASATAVYSIPNTVTCNNKTFTITKNNPDTQTYSNGDGPVITIKLIPADSRLEGLPACSLPIIVKNQNNTQVLLKNVEYYVVQKPVTRNGCPSCPGTGDKHTVQIEATLYRYCIDCVKPQNGVSTPYPLKSQRVFGNICTSKDSSCGWGVTLDCISYGRIQDIWDCTYPDGQENTGVSDSCYNKCAHLEYGPDPLNLTPFAGWWEHNKKEVCGTLNESCGDSPTDCCSINSQNSINSNINAVPDNFLIRNKAIELGYEEDILNDLQISDTAKGQIKSLPATTNFPDGLQIDPYYTTIDYSPTVYAKLASLNFSLEQTEAILNTLSQKILNLENNDGAFITTPSGTRLNIHPKMAFNPDRENQLVVINRGDTPCCSADTVFGQGPSKLKIFSYGFNPTGGKTVKYLLFVAKKSMHIKFRVDCGSNPGIPQTCQGYFTNVCSADYTLGITRLVFNSNGSINTDDSCSTPLLNSGIGGFRGIGFWRDDLDRDTPCPCGFAGGQVYAGTPCPLWDLYLVGQLLPEDLTDLDSTGANLQYIVEQDYEPGKPSDENCFTYANDVSIPAPPFETQWKNISPLKPKYSPLGSAHDILHKFKTDYYEAIQCNSGSDVNTTCTIPVGCIIPDDETSYSSCFCNNSFKRGPITLLDRLDKENWINPKPKSKHYITLGITGSAVGNNHLKYYVRDIFCDDICQHNASRLFNLDIGQQSKQLSDANGDQTSNTVIIPERRITDEIGNSYNMYLDATVPQEFSINGCAYITGDQFKDPEIIPHSYFGSKTINNPAGQGQITVGPVPLATTNTVYSKGGLKQLFQADPIVKINVPSNGRSLQIKMLPNFALSNPDATEIQKFKITAWMINTNFNSSALLTPENAYTEHVLYEWEGGSIPDTELSYSKNEARYLTPLRTYTDGTSTIQIATFVFKIEAIVIVKEETGSGYNYIYEDDTTIRTRTLNKFLQAEVIADGTWQELLPPQNETILFKNKLFGGDCISVDCTNNQLLCNKLEDC